MALELRGATAVLLPGTGSDDDYVHRVFSPTLLRLGVSVVTPTPQPNRLLDAYVDDLDAAARGGPVLVGGVSIGAAVAAAWALRRPAAALGVLAALPAWSGSPEGAAAALTARHTAALLLRDGLGATIAGMRASSPAWLADELTRSWVGQWPALPDAMLAASTFVAPTGAELETLAVPMGLAAATDDPVHPVEVALEWLSAAPRAALRTVTLDAMGADPTVLGDACVAALLEAG
jgi:pimeloyl-ACP methyl ester carboxylesterase